MPVDYSRLVPGEQISSRTYLLDTGMVSRYIDAVGSESGLAVENGGEALVPPMAVAALSLRGVVNDLAIPGGTLHAGQELEFGAAVAIGEALACSATVLQNSVRGDWRFLVVRLEVEDSRGEKVMNGKTTIMLPVSVGTGED